MTSKENKREQMNGEEEDNEPLSRTRENCVGRWGKCEAFTLPVSFLFSFLI